MMLKDHTGIITGHVSAFHVLLFCIDFSCYINVSDSVRLTFKIKPYELLWLKGVHWYGIISNSTMKHHRLYLHLLNWEAAAYGEHLRAALYHLLPHALTIMRSRLTHAYTVLNLKNK